MSHGNTGRSDPQAHRDCERARVKAASGGKPHGSMQSHLKMTGGPGAPANNSKNSFRPGETVKGKDRFGFG